MQFWWRVTKSLAGVIALSAAATVVVDAALDGACACPNSATSPAARVDAALFGVEMPADDEGGTFFVETTRVPLVTGATFGWRLRLNDGSAQVRLREELELPAAPPVWRHTDETHISLDRRTAVTERVARPDAGWLENAWSFTEGDPPGRYRLRVYLDDQLVREFKFHADAMNRGPCKQH